MKLNFTLNPNSKSNTSNQPTTKKPSQNYPRTKNNKLTKSKIKYNSWRNQVSYHFKKRIRNWTLTRNLINLKRIRLQTKTYFSLKNWNNIKASSSFNLRIMNINWTKSVIKSGNSLSDLYGWFWQVDCTFVLFSCFSQIMFEFFWKICEK